MKKKQNVLLWMLMTCLLLCLTAKPVYAIGKAVILEPESATLYPGMTLPLQMYVGGGAASASGWSSSNGKVAAVSSTGLVTAKKAGKADIICKTGFGYNLTCSITVKKHLEVSGYLNKNYKKLVKKAPEASYQDKSEDAAGIGNVYVFKNSKGVTPFFRYDTKTGKLLFLQLSDISEDARQNRFSLYGVSLGMTTKQAKAALKTAKWNYTGKQEYSGETRLNYKKNGHTITVSVEEGKVASLQWN